MMISKQLVAALLFAVAGAAPFAGVHCSRRDIASSYDYVIVGAGASGLTVANRLSEDSGECNGNRLTRPLLWRNLTLVQALRFSSSRLESCKYTTADVAFHSGAGADQAQLRFSDDNEDFVTIPGLAGGAIGTKYDWNTSYAANPELQNRTVSIPQGKIVGGSTKLNRMVFDRGSKSDFDRWADLGNAGWDFDGLLPYFQKVCNLAPAST